MKIVILGGTGNISRQIVHALMNKDHEVTVYNRGLRTAELPAGVRTIIGNRFDRKNFEERMSKEQFDVVIDMICYEPDDIASDLRAFGNRCSHIIFTSSTACYKHPLQTVPPFKEDEIEYCGEHPDNMYGYKKSLMEKYIFSELPKYKGLSWSIVRPTLTFGRGASNFGVFRQNYGLVKRIVEGKEVVIFGDGQTPMSFSFSPDIARGYAAMAGNPKAHGNIYHLCSKEHSTWNQLYETLGKVIGVEPKIIHISTDLLYKANPRKNSHLFFDKQHVNLLDFSKAVRDLHFSPEFTLEKGLQWLVDGWESGTAPEINAHINTFEDELVRLYHQWESQVEKLQNNI